MNKAIGILGGLCLLAMVGGPAQALVVNLTDDHCGGGCGPGGGAVLGQVTLTDTAAGVDFSISVNPGYLFNLSGGGGLNTFNFSVTPTLTAGDVNIVTPGFAFVAPSINQDGFKDFKYAINGTSNGTFAGPIVFSVAGIDFDDFIKSTGNGGTLVFFAADIKGVASGNTGLVGSANLTVVEEQCAPGAGCDTSPTPIPGAVWLFGTVLAGGAGFTRWRKKRKAQLAVAA